ncbi:MAG: 2-oxo acid dehydrogenase subunit E2 [Deltaproteobacteria bacterium]|nr:2-oxo acid dehydrogenase subunit E2 [Deltaproteobacteria bacterium]
MAYEFKLPDLGEGIVEGEIVKWRVKEGDSVLEHQVVVEVETDKAIVEVPSPKKGVIEKILKPEGEVASVGEVIFTIRLEAGEEKRESVSIVGKLPDKEEVLAPPFVRSLAKKLGVDLTKVKGTGQGGRITEADVKGTGETVKKEAADKYGPVERVALKGVRKAIAKNLVLSQKSTVFVTGMDDADVTALYELREKENAKAKKKGVHLTFMPFFIKAAQHALKDFPSLNASMDDEREEVVLKKYYNIGVAIDTDDGLMVSVVRDVDKKTILEIAGEIHELGEKARERKLTLDELKGSSFTITNYGTFGGTYATPVINYPDVAILGTGKVRERPWVVDGKIEIRKILPLSLTFDHRVTDGREAANFLNKVILFLEDPCALFVDSR